MKGVVFRELVRRNDSRGWLCELFRDDELHVNPAMGYVSETLPGVTRGPHEHLYQTDVFCFLTPFKVWLWDKDTREILLCSFHLLVVPPGVVHAYKNIGDGPGLVLNFPDKLYAGPGRIEAVDEMRHEGSAKYRMED